MIKEGRCTPFRAWLPSDWKEPLAAGRLLLLACLTTSHRRATAARAAIHNESSRPGPTESGSPTSLPAGGWIAWPTRWRPGARFDPVARQAFLNVPIHFTPPTTTGGALRVFQATRCWAWWRHVDRQVPECARPGANPNEGQDFVLASSTSTLNPVLQ